MKMFYTTIVMYLLHMYLTLKYYLLCFLGLQRRVSDTIEEQLYVTDMLEFADL